MQLIRRGDSLFVPRAVGRRGLLGIVQRCGRHVDLAGEIDALMRE
ncbi:MAG: hypothetical protein P8R42_29635 [Candidatus Binatia bacterium]|nr:hypothetical protein [Candidatus Binatia bacterium]